MADKTQRPLPVDVHAHERDPSLTTVPTTASDATATSTTSRSSTASRSPSIRIASPTMPHRTSFSDHQYRAVPPSPRTSRVMSQSSVAAVQDLLNNPPKPSAGNPAFQGRDWQSIAVGELVQLNNVPFVDRTTPVEDATNLLIDSGATVLLVRRSPSEHVPVASFDYKDLNQYLLFATGCLQPEPHRLGFFQELAKKAEAGHRITIREAKELGAKEEVILMSRQTKLTAAVEAFGSGVHRLTIVEESSKDVLGMLSQFQLVQFLWENNQAFPTIDRMYPMSIRDLGLGSQHEIFSINGDRPLREALMLFDTENVSSLAVVDNHHNVVGNISVVDVKLLTKSSSAPLLDNTCIHFISVILSHRGLDDGKDSFPVFHISPQSTLAHTVAKLVATRSHRMWVTTPPSPATSSPATPASGPSSVSTVPYRAATPPSASSSVYLHHPHHAPAPPHGLAISSATSSHGPPTSTTSSHGQSTSVIGSHGQPNSASSSSHGPPTSSTNSSSHNPSAPSSAHSSAPSSATHSMAPISTGAPPSGGAAGYVPPLTPTASSPAISAAALPGAHISGRLSGVVSLTDILNLYARASGLRPSNPDARRRRRSSSSSAISRLSLEDLRH